MAKQDVIFELGCEELPSFAAKTLAEAFATNLKAILAEVKLNFDSIDSFGTPRRLSALIKGVNEKQEDQHIAKLGPSKSAAFDEFGVPTKALLGFCKANNLKPENVQFKQDGNVERVVLEQHINGEQAIKLLPKCFQRALAELPIAKLMYWGENVGPFVRPVHWILSLYGEQLIEGEYFKIKAGRRTQGHRYHFPEQYELEHASYYEKLLLRLKVIPSSSKRREIILAAIQKEAEKNNASLVLNDSLLDEVTSIVEWPVAVTGSFSERFLALPEEVLIASMQQHQKCFALKDKNNKLKANFVAVLNIESKNVAAVIAGNEKVICARLNDAAFFFQQDQNTSLDDLIPKLKNITFQAKLGSLADKIIRLERILPKFAALLDVNLADARRALQLSKVDLLTGMVQEFPELEGVMGYYYAKLNKENDQVALALQEQYLPRYANDKLPDTKIGVLLSLLDRLYTLIGIFGVGEKPTGMKDPYKLRRHALAVIRLLAKNECNINLPTALEDIFAVFPQGLLNSLCITEVKQFILERLPSFFAASLSSQSIVAAVLAVQAENMFDIFERVNAVNELIKELSPLTGGLKRVQHILKAAEFPPGKVTTQLLGVPEELQLYQELCKVETALQELKTKKDYRKILILLGSLRPFIDDFFAKVMVMDENKELRNNRLRLLMQLHQAFCFVADLSLLNIS
ncbi:MAG: glycine--tRNA ligase subunit beta [Legionellales bacterium RIFCSPHIGHO2_12_FULL_37_14]|nr:MAG: glycine--tRNA ligase subunit beta [Legionellales bacterium RIFCSPHIGHO2_12_FULL_37_14]